MARGPLTFRRRDLAAAIETTLGTGVERFRVEIERGKIVVVVGENDKVAAEAEAGAQGWDGDEEAF